MLPAQKSKILPPVRVVMSGDSRAFTQSATTIASLLRRTRRFVELRYYVRDHLPKDFCTSRLRVKFIKATERFPCSFPDHCSPSAFDRLLAIRDCTNWDRALILDYDQLILDDISELYDIRMGDDLVAARVCDMDLAATAKNWFGRDLPNEFKKFSNYAFPYEGLLLNLAQMRLERFWGKFIQLQKRIALEDQVALSIALENRITPLERRWNFVPAGDPHPQEAENLSGIVHWAGPNKPWNGKGWRPSIWKAEESSWDELRDSSWCFRTRYPLAWKRSDSRSGRPTLKGRSKPLESHEPINIVFGADSTTFEHIATTVSSILRRTKRSLNIKIYGSGLSATKFENDRLKVEVVPDSEQSASDFGRDNMLRFRRLLAIRRCTEWSRALLLDCRHIALSDIGNVYDWEMEDNLVAARDSQVDLKTAARIWLNRVLPDEYIDEAEDCSFLAGCLLLNLDQMRREGFWNRLCAFHGKLALEEELILSLAAKGRVASLGETSSFVPEWDLIHAEESRSTACMVHWLGCPRPWRSEGWRPSIWQAEEVSWGHLMTRSPDAPKDAAGNYAHRHVQATSWKRSTEEYVPIPRDPRHPVNLVLAADENAFAFSSTTIGSVLRRTDRSVNVRFYTRGVSAESFSIGNLNVEFVKCEEAFPCAVPEHVTASTFDRLLAIRDCHHWNRVLQMDYDQLALCDVGELFDLDLGDSLLASRLWDVNVGHAAAHWFGKQLPRAYEHCGKYLFYYQGPLMNLKEMRRHGTWERLLRVNRDLGMDEQLALAVATDGRIRGLPSRWNIIPQLDLEGYEGHADGILHWTGRFKPWNGQGWRPEIWYSEKTSWDDLRQGAWL